MISPDLDKFLKENTNSKKRVATHKFMVRIRAKFSGTQRTELNSYPPNDLAIPVPSGKRGGENEL